MVRRDSNQMVRLWTHHAGPAGIPALRYRTASGLVIAWAALVIPGGAAYGDRHLSSLQDGGPAIALLAAAAAFPVRPDSPGCLDQRADRHRPAEGDQEPGPRFVLECLAAEAPGEERVQRPDRRRDGGRGDEPAALVADEPAGQRDRRPAAGDESADDDHLHPESPQRPLGPGAPPRAFPSREEPALRPGPEAPAVKVGEIIAEKSTHGGAGDQQRDARVGAARGCDAEGDDRGLAGEHREDRVQGRE